VNGRKGREQQLLSIAFKKRLGAKKRLDTAARSAGRFKVVAGSMTVSVSDLHDSSINWK